MAARITCIIMEAFCSCTLSINNVQEAEWTLTDGSEFAEMLLQLCYGLKPCALCSNAVPASLNHCAHLPL